MKTLKNSTKFIIVTALIFSLMACVTTELELAGHPIDKPVNVESLQKSILFSLSQYSWKIVKSEEGSIIASYSKNDKKILAEIEIVYSEESYTINYIENPEREIPVRYKNWVRNLNKKILTNYYRM